MGIIWVFTIIIVASIILTIISPKDLLPMGWEKEERLERKIREWINEEIEKHDAN